MGRTEGRHARGRPREGAERTRWHAGRGAWHAACRTPHPGRPTGAQLFPCGPLGSEEWVGGPEARGAGASRTPFGGDSIPNAWACAKILAFAALACQAPPPPHPARLTPPRTPRVTAQGRRERPRPPKAPASSRRSPAGRATAGRPRARAPHLPQTSSPAPHRACCEPLPLPCLCLHRTRDERHRGPLSGARSSVSHETQCTLLCQFVVCRLSHLASVSQSAFTVCRFSTMCTYTWSSLRTYATM